MGNQSPDPPATPPPTPLPTVRLPAVAKALRAPPDHFASFHNRATKKRRTPGKSSLTWGGPVLGLGAHHRSKAQTSLATTPHPLGPWKRRKWAASGFAAMKKFGAISLASVRGR